MLTITRKGRRARRDRTPATLQLCDTTVARFRAYLTRHGRGAWKIFSSHQHELDDIDDHLAVLEPGATWDRTQDLGEPEQWDVAFFNPPAVPRVFHSGYLLLPTRQCAVARWQWTTTDRSVRLTIVATPDIKHFEALRTALDEIRHAGVAPTWQVFAGTSYLTERLPRDLSAGENMVLSAALESRLETEIVGFFAPAVRELYEALGVPLRRGVLLYGPPGNGKTSLVRRLGARLPDVRAILLRAGQEFGSDDFTEVVAEWKRQAPALLVIEDLNWLVKTINVSTFLNLLDGIGTDTKEPLLLVATTNHPHELDPAVNSRPGRFDVVIEITNPDARQRETYFRRRLLELDDAMILLITRQTEGLSFAHLEEVTRLSGLIAVKDARRHRTPADVTEAVKLIRAGFDTAASGFVKPLDVPFGLQHLRELKRV